MAEPAPAPAPAPAPSAPWYEGKADAETIGYFKNRGWDGDPVTAAIEASKAHRNAESKLGAPADRLVRLPAKDNKDPAAWDSVWRQFGKPMEEKGYDFTDVKFADGRAIEDSFADTIRKVAFRNHIPKDAVTDFARELVKFGESQDKTDENLRLAARAEGQDKIKSLWGENMLQNQAAAQQGTAKAGIGEEDYWKIADAIGLDKTAEMFRKFGAGTMEAKWHEGGGRRGPVTVEEAKERKSQLEADKAWVARYLKNGREEVAEMQGLIKVIAAAA